MSEETHPILWRCRKCCGHKVTCQVPTWLTNNPATKIDGDGPDWGSDSRTYWCDDCQANLPVFEVEEPKKGCGEATRNAYDAEILKVYRTYAYTKMGSRAALRISRGVGDCRASALKWAMLCKAASTNSDLYRALLDTCIILRDPTVHYTKAPAEADERDTLDYWLGEVGVMDRDVADPECSEWWPEAMPYGVVHPDRGIIALFTEEREALGYRLFIINMELNAVVSPKEQA